MFRARFFWRAAQPAPVNGPIAFIARAQGIFGLSIHRLLRALRNMTGRTLLLRLRLKRLLDPRQRRRPAIERRRGVLFIGYAEGDLGLGQAFRNILRAVALSVSPFAIYPFRVGIETRLIGPFMPERYDLTHAYPINVIYVAPDYAPVVLGLMDRRLVQDSYNVLHTVWELPEAPAAWRSKLKRINEIWAPNMFVANAFRDIFSGPIPIIPNTVDVEDGPYPSRGDYGMASNRYYFMFSFDYFSSPFRKNPLGVVEAFQAAFPRGDENAGLILKSIGPSDKYPDISEKIRTAAAFDDRILVIDRGMSRHEVLGLLHACDCYVSLHRAEGFGLGMAEAMSFGRVVIGTNFSGNTDFLTETTGFPIPYTLRPVLRHEYPWSKGQVWADPDLSAAVSTMRMVFHSPDIARQRAAAGQKFIRDHFAPVVVGQIIKDRINRINEIIVAR